MVPFAEASWLEPFSGESITPVHPSTPLELRQTHTTPPHPSNGFAQTALGVRARDALIDLTWGVRWALGENELEPW